MPITIPSVFLWGNLSHDEGKILIIQYPLVNVYIAMERSTMLLMGKSTISMAIFNSYVTNYQRVYISGWGIPSISYFSKVKLHSHAEISTMIGYD
jgi:hypothetical protein